MHTLIRREDIQLLPALPDHSSGLTRAVLLGGHTGATHTGLTLVELADGGRAIGTMVETVVVNAHWQADQLAGYLARRSRPRTVLLREPALLDTGGSVKAALSLLGTEPFFVVNGRRVLARRDAARTAAPGRCLRSGERGWRAAGAPNLSGPRGGRRGGPGRPPAR